MINRLYRLIIENRHELFLAAFCIALVAYAEQRAGDDFMVAIKYEQDKQRHIAQEDWLSQLAEARQ